ncbi:MAG TPA: hypothetical protein VI565_09765 [Burkholderiales bacterium]|nr:hypothetical protein [Burkholderiales bacterium]
MDSNTIDRLSMTLIHRAEDECAESDPGMLSSAAMVLVGDVYALLVCQDDRAAHRRGPAQARGHNDDVSPFIR